MTVNQWTRQRKFPILNFSLDQVNNDQKIRSQHGSDEFIHDEKDDAVYNGYQQYGLWVNHANISRENVFNNFNIGKFKNLVFMPCFHHFIFSNWRWKKAQPRIMPGWRLQFLSTQNSISSTCWTPEICSISMRSQFWTSVAPTLLGNQELTMKLNKLCWLTT